MLLWQPEITELGAEENALKDPGLGFHSILMINRAVRGLRPMFHKLFFPLEN